MDAIVVRRNHLNALSTLISFRSQGVDSVRVLFSRPESETAATPFHTVRSSETTVAVLGLEPETKYSHVIEAYSRNGVLRGVAGSASSGSIPSNLLSVRLDMDGAPSSGWYLGVVDNAVVVFDSSGRLRWYRILADGPMSATQQANGHFTAFVGETSGWHDVRGYYAEITPAGEVVRTHRVPDPFHTDNHDVLLTFTDGDVPTSHLLGYERVPFDATSRGIPRDTLLAIHTIHRVDPLGSETFRWSASTVFTVADWVEPPYGPPFDLVHPNSLALDLDGNYVVSFRNAAEVTKIDSRTGAVMWRFGGRNNQFLLTNDPLNGFSAQHHAQILPNGNLLLYDNGSNHNPPETRAVEYSLNPQARTAQMVWQFRRNPPIYTPFVGAVQRLRNGNTFVGYGGLGMITEVTPAGQTLMEGKLMNGNNTVTFYRLLRITSPYFFQPP
jgi:hypothetical protein